MSSYDGGTPDRRDNHSHNNSSRKNKNKRRRESEDRNQFGMGETLSLLRQPDLPEFNLTSARPASRDAASSQNEGEGGSSQEWQTVENGRPRKVGYFYILQKELGVLSRHDWIAHSSSIVRYVLTCIQKAKKLPKKDTDNYPSIKFSSKDARLNAQVKLSELQNLVLYILADGNSTQFVSVRHRNEIRKVVVLMVPGLERDMFRPGGDEEVSKESKKRKSFSSRISPDDYYPEVLKEEKLPKSLVPFAHMFEHLWPLKTPGDDRFAKMHSPLQAMLSAPLPKSGEEKKAEKNRKNVQHVKEPSGWKNKRTPITEYLQTAEELHDNGYTVHPAMYDNADHKAALQESRKTAKTSKEDSWADTIVDKFEDGAVPDNEVESGSLTVGREVFAMDCEMCKAGDESVLTRVSIVAWDGSTVLDELVKPDKPITDYVTQ